MEKIAFGCTLLNYISFFISVIFIFRNDAPINKNSYRILQFISLLYWSLSIYLLFFMVNQNLISVLLVSATQVWCLISFWFHVNLVRENKLTLIYSKNLPTTILQRGYYKWIRHPYYTIYLVCYGSVAFYVNSWVTWAIYAAIVLIYWKAAKFEEQKFESSSLRDMYRSYSNDAGMFFPKKLFIRK